MVMQFRHVEPVFRCQEVLAFGTKSPEKLSKEQKLVLHTDLEKFRFTMRKLATC